MMTSKALTRVSPQPCDAELFPVGALTRRDFCSKTAAWDGPP